MEALSLASTTGTATPSADSGISLTLATSDPIIVDYLSKFDDSTRPAKALEALRVGIIAIQSASPALDTRVVEEKFREVEGRLQSHVQGFRDELQRSLDDLFKSGSGSVHRSIDQMFGDQGKLTALMNNYFGADGGKVAALLQNQIGPASPFAKVLDPANREGVILRLQEAVKKEVEGQIQKVVEQFSLDSDQSGLSRMRLVLQQRLDAMKDENAKFFAEMKEAMGVEAGRRQEAEKGTEKGREFEVALYDHVARIGRELGDTTQNVRSIVGAVPRAKVGDYVITLGETSAAPGKNIVIEAKKDASYRMKDAGEEMVTAKENREAEVGIFAFAKGYEPPEVGDFLRIGTDFFVTVDEEDLSAGRPLVFLEAAYKIARASIVASSRMDESDGIDLDNVRREIESLIRELERFAEMSTKAATIANNSKFIVDNLKETKEQFETRLSALVKMLQGGDA
jgi:hypothetical protein